MIIQLVVLILVLIMYLKLLMDLKKGKISLRRFFFWLSIWTGLSLITYFPQIVLFLSNLIGIERAKDFPIYFSIILLFYLLFKIGIKMEEIERGITKIVKKIALDNEE